MIAIVNYGSGNVNAIGNIYRRLGVPFVVASSPRDLLGVERMILPGVGAFDQAISELNASGLRPALDKFALEERKPVLGICVGMQLFAKASEEGTQAGLGWVDGTVRRFRNSRDVGALQLPHMGWNQVDVSYPSPMFEGVAAETGFYFLHSYHFECTDREDELASTEYGGRFTSAVRRGNVVGVQFHPEKSHQNGVALLKAFAEV